MKKSIYLLLIIFALSPSIIAQKNKQKDKGVFKEKKQGFYHKTILKNISDYNETDKNSKPNEYFAVDLSDYDFPVNIDEYTTYWHTQPSSQGSTGTCWSFATTSFFESEAKRISNVEIKLSEMFTAYYEYVDRAICFVKNRGDVYFNQGSEANALKRIMKKYGAVPYSDYSGMLKGQKSHDHSKMFNEMNTFLESVKIESAWNEEVVVQTIKDILNFYMGKPPKTIFYEEKEMSPQEFLSDILKINPDDYYSFMSTIELAYNQKGELVEADNWWHSNDYYNISLDDYMNTLLAAVENGYSLSICGDVSEAGHNRFAEVSIIPTFDIPSDFIDEDSRQFRLSNKTTTGDHCIHIVGYKKHDGDYWFLIKDSGSGAFDGENKGYRFFHEDYIKLKIMNFLVHKNGAKNILDKIIK